MYKTHHSRRRCQAWQLVWSGIKRYIHQRVCKLWLLLAMVCRHQKGASKSLVKWQVDPLGFPMLNLTSPIKWPGHFNPVLRLLSTRAPLPCDGNKDQVRLMSASWWFWICPIDSYNVMIFIGFFRIPNKIDFQKISYFRNSCRAPFGSPPFLSRNDWPEEMAKARNIRFVFFLTKDDTDTLRLYGWMFFPMKIWWRFSSKKMGLMNENLASVSRTGIESAQCGYRWGCFSAVF